MAALSVPYVPMATSNAAGSFTVQSDGFIAGVAMDDPSYRQAIRAGIVSGNETIPMWQGLGIYAQTPAGNSPLGPVIGRASNNTAGNATQIAGFAIGNQNMNGITAPGNNVPVFGTGMSMNYVLFGSQAQIALPCEPSLAAGYAGGGVNQAVYWDFNLQLLTGNNSSSYSVTSLTWSAANGGQVAVVAAAATPVGGVGDRFTLAGVTNTGSGAVALINTQQTVNTFTDNQHFTFLLPGTSAVWGTLGGTITMAYSNAAIPVKIMRVQSGNSMTVAYNPANNTANWNTSGSCALCVI